MMYVNLSIVHAKHDYFLGIILIALTASLAILGVPQKILQRYIE